MSKAAMISTEVILLDPHFRSVEDIFTEADLERLSKLGDICWGKDQPIPEQQLAALADKVTVIICGRWRYGPVEKFPKLRAILDVSGGFPSPGVLDYDVCFKRDIQVLNVAAAFARPVAEMALAMALDCCRGVTDGHQAFLTGAEKYNKRGNSGTFTLFGQRVGFIGYGGIARSLHALLRPFDCRITVFDPWLTPGFLTGQGVEVADLDQLLAQSKVIFVLAAPTSENQGMLDRNRLEQLSPGSVLVLISRAHVVDFPALLELADAGRFRAAIDVFPEEPVPPEDPVRSCRNVLLSAHRAGSVCGCLLTIGKMVADDLELILEGKPARQMVPARPETAAKLKNI